MVVVGVMLHVLQAEAGHIGYMGVHLLGAPEGQGGEGSLELSMEEQGWAQNKSRAVSSSLPTSHGAAKFPCLLSGQLPHLLS